MGVISPLLFKMLPEVFKQWGKKKKWRNGKEEVKLYTFTEDMVLYFKDPKASTRKLFGLINSSGKAEKYKISI